MACLPHLDLNQTHLVVTTQPVMYTYAFMLASSQPLTLPEGIAGPLTVIVGDALGAIAEPNLTLADLPVQEDQLLKAIVQHDQVIQTLFQQTTILPLRFGTVFASETALREHLAQQQTHYLPQLHALTGQVEHTLLITPPPLPLPVSGLKATGKAYLLGKKQQYEQQRAQQIQQQSILRLLLEPLAPLVTATIPGEAPPPATKVFLLVPKETSFALKGHLGRLRQHYPDWQIECSAPLPPYHFVNRPLEEKAT